MRKKVSAVPTLRSQQIAKAQSNFREKMRGNGYRRLQEWVPETTLVALKAICSVQGITQSEAIIQIVDGASRAYGKEGGL